MGDGGVACVASRHVMEHFSTSEPFCGNNTINSIHGFDIKSNSAKFSDQELQEDNRNISNSQSVKEGSSAEEFCKSRGTGASVFATTSTNAAAFVVEHVDRPKRSSRWDVVEENAGNSRINENELGVGLGLHKHDGGDEGHASGSVQEDELGIAENAAKEHLGNQSDRLEARGGSKSRRTLDEVHSRSGHFELTLPRNSIDRHSVHYKSSRTYHDRHSRHFELPSSRSGHDRYSRRSGSVDRGYSERSSHERSSHDRRWQYEERNGYRKSGAEKFHSRYSSQAHEDRQYHRDVGWRENRRHSNYRQSQSGRSDHISDDSKGRFTSHSGSHSRSSYSSIAKDSRSKDVEAQLGISPSQTLASEQSERFSNELQKDSNSARFSEKNALPEEICKLEEPRCRGWFYLDHLGFEQGPSKLGDLKRLVEDGLLQSDHLIKREGTDEWVTVDDAASPMLFGNLSLPTSRVFLQSQVRQFDETSMNKPGVAANACRNVQGTEKRDSTLFVQQDDFNSDRLEDFHIEERVEKLMQGFHLIPGRENEIVLEALYAARHVSRDMEHSAEWEGSPGLRDGYGEYCNHWRDAELGRGFGNACNASKMATRSGAAVDKEFDYGKDVSTAMGTFLGNEGSSQVSGRWPSKGGDWKRIGEVENFPRTQNVVGCDRLLRKKVVLNDGVLLCDIWKSGELDPRREASSHATQHKRLELPPWAYRWQEEKSDPIHKMDNVLEVHTQAGQASSATPKAHASTLKPQVSTPIAQISTPRGSAVAICGYDGLKTTKPNNGDSSKSIIGNKSSSQMSAAAKGLNVCKATLSFQCEMKSVLKSNAAVFKESGPLAWELCTNSHYMGHNIVKFEQVADQPLHQYEIGNTCDHPAEDINMSPSKVQKPGMPPMPEAEAAKPNQGISSGHVRTVKDLKVHMGEWYYRDGAGHEKGPLTFSQLQMLVSEGTLHKDSSVYRKSDNTWVPVSHDIFATLHSKKILPVDSSCQPPGTANTVCTISEQSELEDGSTSQADYRFHTLCPQFVAYARGKLHEHVMKFYKSRDFAAAIGEGLDTSMAPKQSKNSTDTRIASLLLAPPPSTADNAVTSNHMEKAVDLQNSEVKLDEILSNSITGQPGVSHIISRSGLSMSDSEKGGTHNRSETELVDTNGHAKRQNVCKKRRLQVIQEGDKGENIINEFLTDSDIDRSRRDLQQEVNAYIEENKNTQIKVHGWGMMHLRILERVFHFLGADLKSLAFSAATCKHWNSAIQMFKLKSRRVDFSSMGFECTDALFHSVMSGYRQGKIKHIALKGCTNLSADALVQSLRGCSSIVSVDITGCSQFKDVTPLFRNVNWQRSRISGPSSSGDPSEETYCKVKSLKQINDKIYGTSKSSRALDIHMSDDSAGRDTFMPPHEADQGEPMDVDDFQADSKAAVSTIHQRTTHYPKRIRLTGSARSAKFHLEDGSLKGDNSAKSSAGYHGGVDKSIEKHLATTLKEIMGVNTKNFFSHEAAEIDDKIKGGSYSGDIRGGLKSFQDDVFLICRKAFQDHKRDSPAHLAAEEIYKTAHRYISSLEKKLFSRQKSAHAKEILRPGKDKSQGALYSSSSNVKKRLTRAIGTSMKRIKRRRGMSYSDCSVSIEGDVSDRESRRISKQKKRCWSDSETETSESSGFLEEEFQEKEDDNNDMEDSDQDMKFGSEGEDGYFGEQKHAMEDDGVDTEFSAREWGARMTRASLVPPITRKYEVIEEYVVVADEDEVSRKMRVCLSDDYERKLTAAKDGRDFEYAHLEIPELKEYRPRKRLGDEVLEQEVYGIDPYTHNLLLDTMPKGSDFSLQQQHAIIEEVLLRVLNEKVRDFTGTGNTPMEYPLQNVVERMIEDAEKASNSCMRTFFQGLLKALQSRQSTDKYVAYRKGLGVVCNKECGFEKDDFVVEFLGEVYPAWRWFEKQDGIRSLQKNSKEPAPEFYNIFLERPKGDGAGYDLVVVDAMHKANYASRICHSCRPNCEAKVTAVDGHYQIGIYTLRPIQYGEEITFDYNSLTESKEEYEVSVCLCGSHGCRGSYLNLAGAGAFQKVLKECHGLLHRHQLLLEACTTNSVTQEDISDLRCAGLGTCLLSGLPNWAVAFSARVVRFINLERRRLPEQILKHVIKEKKKAGVEIFLEYEKSDAEIQAEGVYNQRLQSLAITLDKVRYIIRKLHQDPTKAPPPLRKLKAAELVSLLWKGEQSLVEELLRCMGPYVDAERLNRLKQQIHAHDPSGSKNVEKGLRESLLWLRDELRAIPSSCRSRHDAAADLIHLYAHTKYFFTRLDYGPLESPPLYISPLDLGPKYADSLGSGFQEWKKIYSKDYALGQLMYWYVQTSPDPGYSLTKARRGCLVLPDISSCYAKTPKQEFSRGYGSKEHAEMIRRMERQPQKQWPKGEFWEFKSNRGLFGSPMFDAVMNNSPLDKELVHWLRNRPVVFDGPWDH